MFDIALQDVKYAIRGIIRNRTFAVTAIAAAAIGVGASTAVFSVVDRILFRALPYGHQDRLVSVGMMAPLDTNEFMFAAAYFDLRRNPGPFEAVTSFQAGTLACDLTEQNPVRLDGLRVEANFLAVFGIAPAAGRMFSAEEDRPNGPHVVMISNGLWRSRYASDPKIVGRTIPIDGIATTVVGVLPANFETPTLTHADLLLPEALNETTERSGRALRVFARLKPGIGMPQAYAQMQPNFARALQEVPPQFRKEVSLRVRPVRDRQVGDVRLASIALFGSVLAVLLITCANIANLLLARAVARDREFAMRAALGASRLRLARQALTESLLLSILGGTAGCGLAYALLRVFIAIAPGGLPKLNEATLDFRVLLFTLLASGAAGLLFGVAPALRTMNPIALSGWRAGIPSKGGLRTALVVIQIAISIVLLTGAGLLLRSLWKLESVPLGIETDHVLITRFVLGSQRYGDLNRQLAFFNELERRLKEQPGIDAAAITDSVPPLGGTRGRPLSTIAIEGKAPWPEGTGGMVSWRYVTPGYFAALGIPLLRGRGFNERDRDPDAYTMVINNGLARRMFPGEDPIGKRVLKGEHGEWFTVVGVAGDVKNRGPARDADPEYYIPRKSVPDVTWRNQEPPIGWRAAAIVTKTTLDPKLVAGALRGLMASLDATLPVETQTMHERVSVITERPRFNAILLVVFAGAGVLLVAVGLFGVMSFMVAERRREIGVRMALGATPARILKSTLGNAARWIVPGLAIGAVGAVIASRFLRSLLFDVEPADPVAIAGSLLLLGLVALAAAAGPAHRASRLDPMETLRQD